MKDHHPDSDEPFVPPVSMLRINSASSSPLTQTSPRPVESSTGVFCTPPTSSKQFTSTSPFNDAQLHLEQQQGQQQSECITLESSREDNAQGMHQSEGEGGEVGDMTASSASAFTSAPDEDPRALLLLSSQTPVCSTNRVDGNNTPMDTNVTSTTTLTSTNTAAVTPPPPLSTTINTYNNTSDLHQEPSSTTTTPDTQLQDMAYHHDDKNEADDKTVKQARLGKELPSCSSTDTETFSTAEQVDGNDSLMEGIEYANPLSSITAAATSVEEQVFSVELAATEQSHNGGDAIGLDVNGQLAAAAASLSTPTSPPPTLSEPSQMSSNHEHHRSTEDRGQEREDIEGSITTELKAKCQEAAQEENSRHEVAEEKEPISIHPTFAQPTVTAASSNREQIKNGSAPTPPSSSSSSSSSASSSSSSEPIIPLQGVIAFNEAVYTAVHCASELYIIPRSSRGFCWNEDLFLKPYQRRSLGLVDHMHQQHLQQRHHQQQSFRYGSPFQSSNNLHNVSSGDGGGGETMQVPASSSPSSSSMVYSQQHQQETIANRGGSPSPSLLGQDSLVTVHEIWLDDHESVGILPT